MVVNWGEIVVVVNWAYLFRFLLESLSLDIRMLILQREMEKALSEGLRACFKEVLKEGGSKGHFWTYNIPFLSA